MPTGDCEKFPEKGIRNTFWLGRFEGGSREWRWPQKRNTILPLSLLIGSTGSTEECKVNSARGVAAAITQTSQERTPFGRLWLE